MDYMERASAFVVESMTLEELAHRTAEFVSVVKPILDSKGIHLNYAEVAELFYRYKIWETLEEIKVIMYKSDV